MQISFNILPLYSPFLFNGESFIKITSDSGINYPFLERHIFENNEDVEVENITFGILPTYTQFMYKRVKYVKIPYTHIYNVMSENGNLGSLANQEVVNSIKDPS